MADEQKPTADEDKSINELLQEYAEDVKDKDLDDFLKNSDEEDEDAFESDIDDDADEDDAEKLMAAEPAKKSGGIFSMLLIIVAFMAAGAGAYIYLNKDEGMTSIMGGFMGQDEPAQEASLDTPPTPDAAPTMLPAPTDEPVANADGTPQPTPITNEAPSADTPADPLAPLTAEPMPALGADVVAVPSPNADALPTPDAAAPASTDAQAAVNQWMSGGDAGVGNADIATVAPTIAPLPEKNVEELKAKPPTNKKAAKKETAKAEPKVEPKLAQPKLAEPKSDAQEAAVEIKDAEPKAEITKVTAPKKKAASVSPADDALPPPYVAIQAKNGMPSKTTTSLSVDTTTPTTTTTTTTTAIAQPVLPKPAPASAGAKMAPIVEGGAVVASDGTKHSASGTGRDVEGKTNQNVSDVTSATGETAAMVAKGGGMIEVPSKGVPAPVGMMPTNRTIAAPTPELRTYKLAIQGGKSLPPGTQTNAYAQIPDTTTGTKPAMAMSSNPTPPAVPVTRVESEQPAPVADEPEPEVMSPRVEAAPSAPSPSESSAPSIVRAAQEAESAGRAGDALELYQRALEVDAVYGGGSSIDRGAVYDRIGAIRAGQ